MYKLLIINLVAIQFMCWAQPIQFKEALIDGQYIVAPHKVQGKYLLLLDPESLPPLATYPGDFVKGKTLKCIEITDRGEILSRRSLDSLGQGNILNGRSIY